MIIAATTVRTAAPSISVRAAAAALAKVPPAVREPREAEGAGVLRGQVRLPQKGQPGRERRTAGGSVPYAPSSAAPEPSPPPGRPHISMPGPTTQPSAGVGVTASRNRIDTRRVPSVMTEPGVCPE